MQKVEKLVIWCAFTFAAAFVLFAVYDLCAHYSEYQFGTEVGRWRLRSLRHYVAFEAITFGLCLIGFIALSTKTIRPWKSRLVSWSALVVFIGLCLAL